MSAKQQQKQVDPGAIIYIDPPTTLANLTVTMPENPIDGEEVKISFGGTITSGPVVDSLSIVGNAGHTVLAGSSITSAQAGDGYILRFQSSLGLWRLF